MTVLAPSADGVAPGRAACGRLLAGMARVNELFIFGLLMMVMLIVASGIIARAVFNASLSWSGELASWTLVWLTFAGMAAGHGRERHIAVNLVGPWLGRRGRLGLAFVADVIVAYATIMLLFGSIGLIQQIGGISTGPQWDNRLKHILIPPSAVLGLVFLALVQLRCGAFWPRVLMPMLIGLALYAVTLLVGPPLPDASPSRILSLAFFGSLAIGVPIGFAMLFGAFLSTWGADLLPMVGVVHTMVGGASPFALLAFPFFLAAGYLMNSGGLATRLIDFASALVGHFRGGLAHSMAGGPGWYTAMGSPNVRAIVAYEPGSNPLQFMFPEGEPRPEGTAVVPMTEFVKLTRIPIQMFYGDNIPQTGGNALQQSWRKAVIIAREFANRINHYGGDAKVVELPEIGIRGNTHFPYADLNNVQVADVLSQYLQSKGLDKREG